MKQNISTSICLVGMPGAGKSCTGKELATCLGVPFYDADTEIETSANMSIPELFSKYGEEHFRQGETKVITRLLSAHPCVIATGGGAFINENTHQVIQNYAISVYLNVPLATLWKRVKNKAHRPLLASPDGKTILQKMYNTRTPIYQQADISVAYQNEAPSENAERIANQILQHMDMQHGK